MVKKTKKKVTFNNKSKKHNGKAEKAGGVRQRKRTSKKPVIPATRTNEIEVDTTKSTEKVQKLKEQISYCTDLSEAYKRKHDEVIKLTNYLKDIVNNMSTTPLSKTDIKDFIHRVSSVPLPNNLEFRKKDLINKKAQQNRWLKEADQKYGRIKNKLNEFKRGPKMKVTKKVERRPIPVRTKRDKPTGTKPLPGPVLPDRRPPPGLAPPGSVLPDRRPQQGRRPPPGLAPPGPALPDRRPPPVVAPSGISSPPPQPQDANISTNDNEEIINSPKSNFKKYNSTVINDWIDSNSSKIEKLARRIATNTAIMQVGQSEDTIANYINLFQDVGGYYPSIEGKSKGYLQSDTWKPPPYYSYKEDESEESVKYANLIFNE